MAGQEQFLLEGGMSSPSNQGVNQSIGRTFGNIDMQGTGGYQPHHGVLGLLLIGVLGLWALHKFGFRFAVTAGRR